jgi:methionyl-tRNA formyltransferase
MEPKPFAEHRWLFFGSPQEAVWVLDTLASRRCLPSLIVTNPPRPAGRGKRLTPPPALQWAQARGIPTLSPEHWDEAAIRALRTRGQWDFGVVAAYGAILPPAVLSIPKHGLLNIHPSLLPKLRGPAPVQAALLNNDPSAIGVSLIVMDEQMDHGPVLAQERCVPEKWPTPYLPLTAKLLRRGAEMLVETAPQWVAGTIQPIPQDDSQATYCRKLAKQEISLDGDPAELWRFFCALVPRPGIYVMDTTASPPHRVKVLDATFDTAKGFIPRIVVPEGKQPMQWEDYLRGRRTS